MWRPCEALGHGHWECFKFWYDSHKDPKDHALRQAALRRAVQYGDPTMVDKLLMLPMYEGDDIVQYFNAQLLCDARKSGNILMIEYCISRGCVDTAIDL